MTVARAAAAALGVALIAYPFTLAPARPSVLPLASAAAALLSVTLATRWVVLAGPGAALIGLEYGVAMVTGDTLLDPYVAPFAAGWLLHIDLVYLACSESGDVTDRAGAHRRLLGAVALASAGCVVALLAQLGASLRFAAGGWVVVVATACAVGALALIPVLGLRALGDQEEDTPG